MSSNKTKVVAADLTGHNRTFRTHIEMRALCGAFAKAKAVSGNMFSTGSSDYWADVRTKVENHKRSELRKVYEKEVRQKLTAIFAGLPKQGFAPYIKYMVDSNDRALRYRRELDAMIQDEMDYARRNEKLFGLLGRTAVLTKLGADIVLSILGAAAPFVGSLLIGLGYSGAQDVIKNVEASWAFRSSSNPSCPR